MMNQSLSTYSPSAFCFGAGYVGTRWLQALAAQGWPVAGTTRTRDKADALLRAGISTFRLENAQLEGVTHLLISVPPDEAGDPVWRLHREVIRALPSLQWLGYLSTTGVYGDHAGAWVDESTPLKPDSPRATHRLLAETQWLGLGVGVKVFRLGGIYGDGRNALEQLYAGTARRIMKPGQFFSRVHVEDILLGLFASMNQPQKGAVFNLVDDEPAPASEVVEYAASLLGMEPPPAEIYGEVALPAMLASFYAANRRVSNARIKSELGISLAYPSYRDGLAALMAGAK